MGKCVQVCVWVCVCVCTIEQTNGKVRVKSPGHDGFCDVSEEDGLLVRSSSVQRVESPLCLHDRLGSKGGIVQLNSV